MTIMEVPVTVLIQAGLLVYQAATANPVIFTAMETSGSGGRLRSPVPTHGDVVCSTATPKSPGTATVKAAAYQLVASKINLLLL